MRQMNRARMTIGTAAAIAVGSLACAHTPEPAAEPGVLVASPQQTDDMHAVLFASLAAIRSEVAFGRFVVDRGLIDTTKRSAPPLISGREHSEPELWARPNRAETAQSEYVKPVCANGSFNCRLREDIEGTAGFSLPVIRDNQATVIVRWTVGTGQMGKGVRTTVERFTLTRVNGEWQVTKRDVRLVQ